MGRRKKADMDKLDEVDTKILKLANKGCTSREIASAVKLSQSAICQRMQRIKNSPEFKAFTSDKAMAFEILQKRMMDMLEDDEVLEAVIRKQGVIPIAVLQDKIRVMRGEVTEITAIDIRALGVIVNQTPPGTLSTSSAITNNYQDVIDVTEEEK